MQTVTFWCLQPTHPNAAEESHNRQVSSSLSYFTVKTEGTESSQLSTQTWTKIISNHLFSSRFWQGYLRIIPLPALLNLSPPGASPGPMPRLTGDFLLCLHFQTSPRTYPGVYVQAQAFPVLKNCEKLSFLLLHTIPLSSFTGVTQWRGHIWKSVQILANPGSGPLFGKQCANPYLWPRI